MQSLLSVRHRPSRFQQVFEAVVDIFQQEPAILVDDDAGGLVAVFVVLQQEAMGPVGLRLSVDVRGEGVPAVINDVPGAVVALDLDVLAASGNHVHTSCSIDRDYQVSRQGMNSTSTSGGSGSQGSPSNSLSCFAQMLGARSARGSVST